MSDQFFTPPRPDVSGPPPRGFALLRALRTNVLHLWPREAYEQDSLTQSFLGRPLVLLNAPDAIRRVLVENDENYRRSRIRGRLLRPVAGEGLLVTEGQVWKHQRRTAAPAFTPRGMGNLARHVAAAAQEGVGELAGAAAQEVDLFGLVQGWAAEMSGRSMFSLEMRSHGADMKAFAHHYVSRLAQPYPLDVLLPIGIPSPRDLLRRRFKRSWMRLVERMIETRRQAPEEDAPRDLLDLMRAARDPETGEGFSRPQLRDQVATMIVAGHETSSVAMFWSLYLLASAPDAQERVAEEVRGVDLGPENAAETLRTLPWTRAVVSEALRLYPPAFMIVREAIGADRCGDTDVPAGAMVMVSPWVVQRHRRIWERPDEFDPARFLPGAAAPHRFAYLPFSTGPRVCIGAQLAVTMTAAVVASLVQSFRVELADAAPVLPVCVATTRPDRNPRFRLRRR